MSPPKKPLLGRKRTREDGADAAESSEERTLHSGRGKKMRICRLAFITTMAVIMCNYRATAFAEIDERRIWRKNEGVSAEACGRA